MKFFVDTAEIDAIAELKLVPVSISYEYDPCDLQKAQELHDIATRGSYAKSEFEDIRSIVSGITGSKGRVQLKFGTPVGADMATPDEVAAEIDRQVIGGYRLFPSHYLALEALGESPELVARKSITRQDRERFKARLASVPEALQPYWLEQYANPVKHKAGRLSI